MDYQLPPAHTSQDMYMAAVVAELRALREMLASALGPAAGEGLDGERLRAILVAVKGVGEVTADRVIAEYLDGN